MVGVGQPDRNSGLLSLSEHRLVLSLDRRFVGRAENLVELRIPRASIQAGRLNDGGGELRICDGIANEWFQIRVEMVLLRIFDFLAQRVEVGVFLGR